MSKKHTVLIVDDEQRIRSSLAGHLTDEGHQALEAANVADAEELLLETPVDAVFLDVKMPGEDGVSFLERRSDLAREVPIIVMSGHGTIELAIQAVKLGAYDFLEKGFSPERMTITLDRALRMHDLKSSHQQLKQDLGSLHRMVGKSKAMTDLQEAIKRAAPSGAKVLLLGENGVGKELVARALHELGPSAEGPFVRLNCAAIPKELVESELFGHEKGAFTGAVGAKRGKVESAQGGTLFLDEIGDMHLEAQAKLLRALEVNEFERVGSTKVRTFDARVIAATNKDLAKEVEAENFRRDLFYRMNVLPIVVPPLRERREDVPLLVEHYLEYFLSEYGRAELNITSGAINKLQNHSWPGNIRELRNLVERLVIMTPGSEVDADQLAALLSAPETVQGSEGMVVDIPEGDEGLLKRATDAAERQVVLQELEAAGWNVSQAARVLGIDRANLHRKIKRLGLERS